MRKIFKILGIVLLILFVALQTSPVQGIELNIDVEDALQEFVEGYRLSQFEIDELSDPFVDFRSGPPPENDIDGENGQEDIEDELIVIEPPEFKVTGVVSRGEELAVVIEDGDAVEILKQGQTLDGYIFSHRLNDRIVFAKEGEQFELFVREGETR